MPRVSVICAAYQGESHLQPTIEGLLAQRMRNFEAVFVDDASSDGTSALLGAIGDPRFRVVRNPANLGLVETRNRAVALARGRYIAVTDQDDPSHPERLGLQADWLDAHPEASAVYTLIRSVDARGRPREGVSPWTYSGQRARAALVFHNFVTHSTLMFRRDRVAEPVYPGDYPLCEDYWLLVRLADEGSGLHAIRRPLVDYRYHDTNHTRVALDEMKRHANGLRGALLGRMGLAPSDAEMALHERLGGGTDGEDPGEMCDCRDWLAHVVEANRRARYVPVEHFEAVASSVWLEYAHKFAKHGLRAWREYTRGPTRLLPGEYRASAFKLGVKCALPRLRRRGSVDAATS